MPDPITDEMRAQLAVEIEDAVTAYQRVFPAPYRLAPNLDLAVRALAALRETEADRDAWKAKALRHAEESAEKGHALYDARRKIKAAREVLAGWQVEGYSALIRRIHRALAGDPP